MRYRDGNCGVPGCKHRRSSWTVAGELFRLWLWVHVWVIGALLVVGAGILLGEALQ